MAKNRKTRSISSHKQKQERLADAKQRRHQAEAEAAARIKQLAQKDRFTETMINYRKNRNVDEFIEFIWSGGKPDHYLSDKLTHIRNLYDALKNSYKAVVGPGRNDEKKSFLQSAKDLVLILEKRRCRFFDRPGAEAGEYRSALIALLEHREQWANQPETWEPGTKNAGRQFAALLRHLLAKYEIPVFMDEAWIQRDELRIGWWIHVAQGGNIRTAKELPTPLTKMMAHHMMQAPSHYSIDAAIRWGQIHALEGNERIVKGLLDSRLCTMGDFVHDEFWITVFRWLIANPMLDPAQYAPIVDYIYNQKYVTPIGANGPVQPGFTIKDRQANTLLKLVEDWHERLKREGRVRERQHNSTSWEHNPKISDYQLITGPENKQTVYQIVQLLTSKDLYSEGARLSHCVGSYAWSCAAGRTSIWSTRRLAHPQSTTYDLLGTIEVENASNRIVQFRAKNNDKPSEQAFKLINQWAGINKLSLSSWL